MESSISSRRIALAVSSACRVVHSTFPVSIRPQKRFISVLCAPIARDRAKQLREVSGFENAGVYDPDTVGGTHVIYVLHDAENPEAYGGLPKTPRIPIVYTLWKQILKPLGLFSVFAGAVGIFFQY